MAELEETHPELKIIVVGDASVGKSCLISRYINNTFDGQQAPTVGAAFLSKDVTFRDKTYTLNIWDTAGQESFRYLVPMYYRGADIAILSFDITNLDSFKDLSFWREDLIKNIGDKVTIVFCGNKQDLENIRQVSEEEIAKLTQETGLVCVETSAATGSGVSKLFEVSLNEFFLSHPDFVSIPKDETKVNVKQSETSNPEKKGCC